MINKECFTTEWIAQKSTELQYNDKNLIEKVIRAFLCSKCCLHPVVLSISRVVQV